MKLTVGFVFSRMIAHASHCRGREVSYRGTHEVEENFAEFGGSVSFIDCTKNPDHPQFIPVYEFSEDQVRVLMPDEEQWIVDKAVEYVKCCADLMVRISVHFITFFISNQRANIDLMANLTRLLTDQVKKSALWLEAS
ncbi:uncharacterized protein LOC101856885 [Aplysia californica]|uniref:Uncharacterized protein LOC101856885 n=1 Tax=Aplysia californica TaxID=6500 RepID=A0ABM0JLP2_APLCA|nr:uncharacterized protein LOC101856885 [Aplysia californica]